MKESSLVRLSIRNAEFYSYHGVRSEEKKLGGKYQVDLDLYYDATSAIINDDVKYALNYEEAMFCVSEVINNESYSLVETIVNEILNMTMEKFPEMQKCSCRVRKLSVPMRRVVDHIEVEQTMIRKKS
ncbi:MAG: dihydroneopterin aldolase [Candidatus Kapaibacterium sp.]